MAATCQQIITYAMRQRGILAIGKEPKAAEAAEGMVALQSLYDSWRTGAMFGQLTDDYLTEDDVAEEGYRYYIPSGVTLTPATSIYDDNGTTRQPRDLALYETLTAAGVHSAKLYDRTAWVELTGLTLASDAPLSGRNAYGLAACLATYGGFAAAFGGEASQDTVQLARQFLRGLMSKQGSTQDRSASDYY